MDEERRNDAEGSEFLKNVGVDDAGESSVVISNCVAVTDNTAEHDALRKSLPISEDVNHNSEKDGADTINSNSNRAENVNPTTSPGDLDNNPCDTFDSVAKRSGSSENLSEAVVKISKPLCANYRSGSDTDSLDSESDSSTSSDETSETSSENEEEGDEDPDSDTSNGRSRKQKENKALGDLSLSDLPPIEDLRISVPEDACVEVGKISGIVDTLVVVESYKGTAALDVDTVLFLDCGKRTLGKVFDILGPIAEPVYTVRFNSQDQIKSLNIQKEQKVYYAPKTQHTTFVFLSEVLKNKGSDASWKDNIEAPSEFQDFSDDEKERQHKDQQKRECDGEKCSKESNKSRKRSFSRSKQTSGVLQPSRFRHPTPSGPRRPHLSRTPAFVQPPAFPAPVIPSPSQTPVFPYNVPPYPGTSAFATAPHPYYPPRFSGPSFPPFGGHPFVHSQRAFHQPFFQQRSHSYRQPPVGGVWSRPMFRPPPPPPPPPDEQNNQEQADGKTT